MSGVRFAAPHAPIEIRGADDALLAVADRLWERGGAGTIPFRIEMCEGPAPGLLAERGLTWRSEAARLACRIPGVLGVTVDARRGRLAGVVTRAAVETEPALVGRALLESPVAALLTFRLAALHAGAVVGPRGAVVIRGAPGAGKSTLVAACHAAGMRVLGDESLLVDPRDPEILVAAVRDLTLRDDSPALAGLATTEAFSGGEPKRRADLFAHGTPRDRTARRAAVVLLGRRAPGLARLVPLAPAEFLAQFGEGAVPQEGFGAGTSAVAAAWASRAVFRLEGHEDLEGAVACVRSLTN